MAVIDDEGGDAELPSAIRQKVIATLEREIGISIVRINPDHRRREVGHGGLPVARMSPSRTVQNPLLCEWAEIGPRHGFVEALLLQQCPSLSNAPLRGTC